MNQAIIFIGIALTPAIAFAQGTLWSLIATVGDIAGLLVSIFSMLAFVAFFYGLGIFILNAGDEKRRDEGKPWMFWSIAALFVLVTIWGIIGLLQNTVGNDAGPKVDIIVPRF
jgi:hypothetical protein